MSKTAAAKRDAKRIEKEIFAVQAQITAERKHGSDWNDPILQRLMAKMDGLCGAGQ